MAHKSLAGRRAYRKRAKAAIRSYIKKYLETHPCVDCGEADRIILEFDHRPGTKTFDISKAARNKVSLPRLEVEMKKCEVRCANCHRRKTISRLSRIPT